MREINFESLYGANTVQAALFKLETDRTFREEAEADLNAAVLRHFGVTLPLRMRLVEDEIGFRAEIAEAVAEDELSDSELDLVAGGAGSATASGPVAKGGGPRFTA
ncbi:hypothetical protein J2847_003313 [Azospirillum agricola]|uniref:hypothetical protein n=1 Tax=Azospirillum agricola TaxID=1720247 RepID=UPI001AEAA5FD|nr:hypothetical protein [Azospirillum agricola]MBP2230010.1 hypothetical protein [Azospirillum agricola]